MTAFAEDFRNRGFSAPTFDWRTLALGGGAALAALLVIDGLDIENFPINLIGHDGLIYDTTPPVYDTTTPGFEVTTHPLPNILNIDQPNLEPGEKTRIGNELMDQGYWGNSNNTRIAITSPATLGLFAEAVHKIDTLSSSGLSYQEAIEVVAKQSRPDVAKALLQMSRMKQQVVLITDRDMLGVFRLTHNGRFEFYPQ